MSSQTVSSLVLAQATDTVGSLMGMAPILLMFVVLYFLMIRPQMKRQKEHKALLAALAKGDEVISAGGMLGTVTKVSDSYITVQIAEHGDKAVEVVMQKASVSAVLPKGTIKAL